MNRILLLFGASLLLSVLVVSCTCSSERDGELSEREKEKLIREIEEAEEKIAKAEKQLGRAEERLDRSEIDLEEAERKIEEGMKNLGEGLSEAMSELTKELENAKIELDIESDEEYKDWEVGELEDYVPSRLIGMKRVSLDKGSGSFFKLGGSGVTAVYEDGNESLELSIINLGAFGKLAGSIMKNVEFDVESDSDNSEAESIEYKGQTAFKTYDKDSEDGNFIVFIEDLLIVNLESNNVSKRNLDRAMDQIKIRDMASRSR